MANDTEKTIVLEAKKQSGLSKALDKVFHFTERGSTMGSEIGAGFSAFFIAACALIMNTQIIGEAYGNYAGAYLAVTLLALVGTIVLGLVCNLPLIQSANMGLSAVLISMLSANESLTYANLMVVTFVAALIYLAVVVSPARKLLVDGLPDGVKKAMPVAVGIYVILTALQNTGLLGEDGTLTHASSLTTLDNYYFWLMLAGVVIFLLFKAFGRKKPAIATFGILIGLMWVGGIVFFLDYFVGGQTASTIVYQRLNLVVATDGAQPYNLAGAIGSLNIGALFTEGLDFSAYTAAGGNVVLLFLQGVLTFLCLGLYTNQANTEAVAVVGDYDEADYAAAGEQKALAVGAALNVVAPILGVPPTSIGAQSAAAAEDRGKTGLASMAAAVGFLIASFTWIFVMLFATGTNGVGMWIEETETKLAAYVQDTFVFADLIMVLVGAGMLKGIRKVDVSKAVQLLPFAVTVVAGGFLGNIALGVALGWVAAVLCKAAVREERKTLTAAEIVLAVVMLLLAILFLI